MGGRPLVLDFEEEREAVELVRLAAEVEMETERQVPYEEVQAASQRPRPVWMNILVYQLGRTWRWVRQAAPRARSTQAEAIASRKFPNENRR